MQGKKIDILGFDASLMASIELQSMCVPYVHYYVASEEVQLLSGWNYKTVLNAITHDSKPKEFAQAWVKAYYHLYAPISGYYTLSAVDLNTISPLAENINAVAQTLVYLLKHQQDQSISVMLQKATAPSSVICFKDYQKPDYIDLDHLYANILEQLQMYYTTDMHIQKLINATQELLIKGRELIGKIVIANAVSKRHARAGGISIYWAQEILHSSYSTLVWTQVYPYWEKLLRTYLDTRNLELKL